MAIYSSKDGAVERRILIALILSKSILGRVAARWDGHLFRSLVANTIASMCVDYYKKHGEAPNRAIDSVYDSWAESQRDSRWVEQVGSLIEELGHECRHEDFEINPDHLIDITEDFIDTVKLETLHSDLGMALQAHDRDKANRIVGSYRRFQLAAASGIDFFNDPEELQALFLDKKSEVLVEYSGAVSEFFEDDLARDSFVVFTGSAKSGKTFLLHDISYMAMTQRRKVAYFEAGDLSKRQAQRRLVTRTSGHPYKSTLKKDPKWPCTVNVPTKMEVVKDEDGRIRAYIRDWKTKKFQKPVQHEIAEATFETLRKKKIRSEKSHFKLSVHSCSSLSIDTIKYMIDEWNQDDWLPDVLVIDYADLLAYPNGAKDERDAINKNWQALRRLSQDLHCLVVTGTQADAESYSKEFITKKNFSGDRRKNDIVTAMYAINCNDDERERGVCRFNVVVRRDGEGVSKRFLYVAQCLPLARPIVLSSW